METKENSLLTNDGLNRGNSGALLCRTGAGETVAFTLSGPAGLQNVTGLAAHVLDNLELTGDEVTGLVRGGAGVKVRVSVRANDVNDLAHRGNVLANPGRDDIGSGVETGVAGRTELTLDVDNKVAKLSGSAVVVEHGLVTNDDHGHHVPLRPVLQVRDLLSKSGMIIGAARLVNENTSDDLDTMSLTGRANGVEGVAVGGVNTDGVDSGILDGTDFSHNGLGRLAVTGRGVWGVGDTEVLATAELGGGAG